MEPTEIITMLRAKLAEIWDEHQDDPELGRNRLGMWKDQAKRRICRFSPERATEFWNLHGNPHSQIEDKAEREYKIFQSEVEKYDRYLAALQMHAKDFPRFWQVEAEAQKPIAEAAGTPTPQMSAADDTDVRIGILSVPLKPQEVHRHLVNLCNKDGRFAILDPKPTDESLEKLLVFDAQKLTKANSDAEARRTVIGTVRLLPEAGDGTTMIFDAKDAIWHQEITAEKRGLFHEFFQRNRDYWKRLLAGEIKPAEERDTTSTPAEGGAGKLRGPTVQTGGGLVLGKEEKAFRLGATPETFANWLQVHTKGVWTREFPVKGGYCKLRMAHYRVVPGQPSPLVTIDGYYIGENDDEEVTRFEPFLNNAITFEVIRLDPERIKVIARCNLPPVMTYFRELLAAIAADWPEVAEQSRAPTPPQVMTPFTEHQVIVKKSPRDLWDILKKQKEQFEEINAPVMLAGPFHEADVIRCVLKYVPDPHKRIPDESHRGMIEMIEIPDGRGVRVIFRLDTFPDPELFWQTVDKLMEKLGAPVVAIDREVPVVGPPRWFPKKPETIRKWKEAYSTFVDLRAEYLRRYENLDTDDPNPKIGDYRDAIHGRYCEKVVSWILSAGDSGWLE
jgi:hypothetical protein